MKELILISISLLIGASVMWFYYQQQILKIRKEEKQYWINKHFGEGEAIGTEPANNLQTGSKNTIAFGYKELKSTFTPVGKPIILGLGDGFNIHGEKIDKYGKCRWNCECSGIIEKEVD